MAYQGFKSVQNNVEKEGYSPKEAGAITASIGRKKYGKKKFQAMASVARKRSGK